VNVLAISHGEKAWSLSGHTRTTDIPLTDNRRRLAERMRPVLARNAFALVLCSPVRRARETCELAGLGASALINSDLVEWNGQYEGLTPQADPRDHAGLADLRGRLPGRRGAGTSGCARGSRDRPQGHVALFAHAHVLRGARGALDRAASRRWATFSAGCAHSVCPRLLPRPPT
jgi:broad specificity phosphatase PhoE